MVTLVDEPIDRRAAGRGDERGQGMIEYAFILVLVAMVLIVMVTLIGHQTSNMYSNISSGLGT